MSFLRFFVRNGPFTIVLMLCFAALGVSAWLGIPRTEDPVLKVPGYTVIAVAPGTNPTDLERLVARPLEDAIKELEDIVKLTSTVRDGLALVSVEFRYGVDTEAKYDAVLRQVASRRADLPADLLRLEVRRVRTINVAVRQVALVSETADYAILQDLLEALRKRIEIQPGVRLVEKWAYPEKQVRVTLDADRLIERGVSVGEIIGALQRDNTNVPGGAVEIGTRRFSIRTSGTFSGMDEIADLALRRDDAGVLRLRDVATVAWDLEEPDHLGRYRGERAVFATVLPQEGVNAVRLSEPLSKVLEEFREELPEGIRLESGFDQSRNIERRLGRLETDFLIAFALVLVTLIPLGFRASLLVLVSIPLSLALGLTLMQWTGNTLNQLSIVGFVIALGLLVDDSIVVVENIARFRRQGFPPEEAAVGATRQIAVAVIGTTFALLFAFLPLMLLPGGAGQFIRPLPLAVVFTVFASLIVALAIVPYLASRLLTGREDPEGSPALRLLEGAIHRSYKPALHFCMRHRGIALGVAALLFVGSLGLLPRIGFSLFPGAGTPQFSIRVDAGVGAGIQSTDTIMREVERVLAETPDLSYWFANIGRGNPQIYYNEIPAETQPGLGEVFAEWQVADEAEYARRAEELRERLRDIPGARIVVKEFENGPPITAPIAVRILATELGTLEALAGKVGNLLESVPGTRDVDNPMRAPRTDLAVRIDRERADRLGVSQLEIDRAVRLAFAGIEATRFREEDGDEYGVRVTLPRGAFADISAWERIAVASPGGAIPIQQVARLELGEQPALIQRYNRERSVTVSAFVESGYNVGRVTGEVERLLGGVEFPPGARWEFGGEVESRNESFAGLGGAVVIATFGILAVLVLEFRSFRGTLVVASVVPLGVIGGLVALWLTGNSLSFTAAIGFIALTGIEIKNSILLVDFTNQLREAGVPINEAIERAGETRFLPVVLTTVTAVGALLPLAIEGSGLYSPLAIVIIGGLVSSLVLSRIITPVLYSLIPPER